MEDLSWDLYLRSALSGNASKEKKNTWMAVIHFVIGICVRRLTGSCRSTNVLGDALWNYVLVREPPVSDVKYDTRASRCATRGSVAPRMKSTLGVTTPPVFHGLHTILEHLRERGFFTYESCPVRVDK